MSPLCLCLLPGLVCCATSTAAASLLGLQRARTVGPLSSPALPRAGRSSRPHKATRGTRRAALCTAQRRHPLLAQRAPHGARHHQRRLVALARRAPSRAARRGATRPASERRGEPVRGAPDRLVHTLRSVRPRRGPRATSNPPRPPPRACSSTRRTPSRSRRCCTVEARSRGRRVSAGRWSSQEPLTAPK